MYTYAYIHVYRRAEHRIRTHAANTCMRVRMHPDAHANEHACVSYFVLAHELCM